MCTRKRLKNITKPPKPRDRCILALTHPRDYSCKLATYIDIPIESKLNYCYPCEKEQHRRYESAIKRGEFDLIFEQYKDIQFENSLISIKSLMQCEHSTEEMRNRFNKKLEDFQGRMVQKILGPRMSSNKYPEPIVKPSFYKKYFLVDKDLCGKTQP